MNRIRSLVLTVAALMIASALPLLGGAPPAAASDNGLSVRPAMGWSSWSFVRRTPTEAKMRAQADAMVSRDRKSVV